VFGKQHDRAAEVGIVHRRMRNQKDSLCGRYLNGIKFRQGFREAWEKERDAGQATYRDSLPDQPSVHSAPGFCYE
jgi:hypothetical protein